MVCRVTNCVYRNAFGCCKLAACISPKQREQANRVMYNNKTTSIKYKVSNKTKELF